jgi:hypothetical protein
LQFVEIVRTIAQGKSLVLFNPQTALVVIASCFVPVIPCSERANESYSLPAPHLTVPLPCRIQPDVVSLPSGRPRRVIVRDELRLEVVDVGVVAREITEAVLDIEIGPAREELPKDNPLGTDVIVLLREKIVLLRHLGVVVHPRREELGVAISTLPHSLVPH